MQAEQASNLLLDVNKADMGMPTVTTNSLDSTAIQPMDQPLAQEAAFLKTRETLNSSYMMILLTCAPTYTYHILFHHPTYQPTFPEYLAEPMEFQEAQKDLVVSPAPNHVCFFNHTGLQMQLPHRTTVTHQLIPRPKD